MIPTGIEEKYDVVKVLRESAATTVLLVNYRKIGALRILKAIHRAHPDANSILSEAHLLQGIKSSQLPTIYSVEDTNDMYYLVEEFIDGISLREYLLETKISKEELIKLSLSICDVVEALHTSGNEPVLYRDLKPEHLILRDGQLYLIDFGISVKKSESAKAMPLGTCNWAAPEQLAGQMLDERCDIYSLGKIIEFLQINSYAKDDFKIKEIVKMATNTDLTMRTSSVKEVKKQLLAIQGKGVYEKFKEGNLCKKIAVVGGDHGIGTTFIAIQLCRYLNKRGIDAYYKNDEKNIVHHLLENLKQAHIKEGVLYHDSFKGILNYGDAIEHYKPPEGLYVMDCGTNLNNIFDSDIVLFVTCPSPWKNINYPDWIREKYVYVISNFSSKLSAIKIAKSINNRVFMYPTVLASKNIYKEEEKLFSSIFKNEKDFI